MQVGNITRWQCGRPNSQYHAHLLASQGLGLSSMPFSSSFGAAEAHLDESDASHAPPSASAFAGRSLSDEMSDDQDDLQNDADEQPDAREAIIEVEEVLEEDAAAEAQHEGAESRVQGDAEIEDKPSTSLPEKQGRIDTTPTEVQLHSRHACMLAEAA